MYSKNSNHALKFSMTAKKLSEKTQVHQFVSRSFLKKIASICNIWLFRWSIPTVLAALETFNLARGSRIQLNNWVNWALISNELNKYERQCAWKFSKSGTKKVAFVDTETKFFESTSCKAKTKIWLNKILNTVDKLFGGIGSSEHSSRTYLLRTSESQKIRLKFRSKRTEEISSSDGKFDGR